MIASRVLGVWAYRDLVRNLVSRDLRVKYKGSILGFSWSLLHPLLMAAVYTLAFKYVVRVRIDHFPVFLLSGLLPWLFLTTALSGATNAITANGPLVRKVAFPRAVLPLSAIASQFVQFALMYVVLIPFAVFLGTGLSAVFPAVILLMVLQLLFTSGLGLALATAHVYFRDTRHLLEVLLQVWFWLTPIVYSLSLVPAEFRPYFSLNPMAHFVSSYHTVVLEHHLLSAPTLAALVTIAAGTALAGLAVFFRHERRFAELV